MNGFVSFDLKNGSDFIRLGIMNILSALENNEIKTINLGDTVKYSIIIKCLEERGYHHTDQYDYLSNTSEFYDYWEFPNDKNKCICIEGSVLDNKPTIISIQSYI